MVYHFYCMALFHYQTRRHVFKHQQSKTHIHVHKIGYKNKLQSNRLNLHQPDGCKTSNITKSYITRPGQNKPPPRHTHINGATTSLMMSNCDLWDRFCFPTLTLMIDSYYRTQVMKTHDLQIQRQK